MILIVAFLILLMILLFFIALIGKSKKSKDKSEHSYIKLEAIFTPAERSFFGVLKLVITDDVVVFGKVRVADVITPKKTSVKGDWQRAFNKISAKHFDYVICKSDNLSFVCAIELDDKSHNTKRQKDRDELINSACESANLPLVRFPAKLNYDVNELRESLSDYFSDIEIKKTIIAEDKSQLILQTKPKNVPDLEGEKETSKKLCPKCSSGMRIKLAKRGKNAGNEFWACSAYPKCRHIEAISV